MRTLSRYFVARFMTLFCAILFVSTLAIASVEMLVNLDDMLRTGSGYSGALNYLFLRIPSYYGPELLPISGFAAGLLCFGLAGHSRETLAARAGGFSLFQTTTPVLLAAIGLSLLTFGLNETWIADSARSFEHRQEGDLDLRPGTFWYRRGQSVYNVGGFDPHLQQIRNLEIFELGPDGRLERRIRAAGGQLQPDGDWKLRDVTIQAFLPGSPPRTPEIVRLESLPIAIDSVSRDALLAADPKTLHTGWLLQAIQTRQRHGEAPNDLVTRLHLRLAGPASLVVLCLGGMVLGLQVERTRSLGTPIVAGCVVLALFYATRNGIETLSLAALVPGWAIWVALLVFGAAFTAALWHSPR